jgi:predicted enzyme related to lactoylglutathione lyase
VTWFEVIGKDGDKTREFYSQAFGWKMEVDQQMNYGMVDNGGAGINGGVGQGDPGVRFYVETPDVQAALDKIESLGGKTVMPPLELPTVTIAQFADPDGNVVGLWRPNG